MRIALTTTLETARYAVKNGQIYYVKLSKPEVASDLDDPFAKVDVTPYANKRTLSYGVFENNEDGYSAKARNIRKITFANPNFALERFAAWCERNECNLSWEEARELVGWN